MNIIQPKTFQNATGKIDYTLRNDYMFRVVLQESRNTLKELCAALLHLDSQSIKSTAILNVIEVGDSFDAKTFVLDVKVLLNNAAIINLEMQVLQQDFWNDRSLSYLCSIFNNLEKGDGYSQIKPAYHIGIVDFSPFPEYPELYAVHKMTNIKYGYIYNDNFTLNVLDLNQIHLATKEDKAYGIDQWAKLFKAQTWEDFKMLAQNNAVFEEACETVFKLNQDDRVRHLCKAREDGERILRTYQHQLAERDSIIADIQAKNAKIQAENAQMQAENAQMQAENARMQAENAAMRAELEEIKRKR